MSDLIGRADAIDAVWKLENDATEYVVDDAKEIHGYCTAIGVCVGELSALQSADITDKLELLSRAEKYIITKSDDYEYEVESKTADLGAKIHSDGNIYYYYTNHMEHDWGYINLNELEDLKQFCEYLVR